MILGREIAGDPLLIRLCHFEIPLARKGKYLYHKHIKRGGVCPVNAKQKEIQT